MIAFISSLLLAKFCRLTHEVYLLSSETRREFPRQPASSENKSTIAVGRMSYARAGKNRVEEQNMMQAIRIHSYGGPEVMRLEALPMPVLRPGAVLVRVHAASVNFIDIQKRRGELVGQRFYERWGSNALPAMMGSQGAGVVETVASDVTNFAVGDRVSFWGASYATHVALPAVRLIRIPAEISFEQAAAGLNQGFLAYAFTHFAYAVRPGDWCLVQAAAGGVGLLLCQMVKIRKGRVIGVTSSEAKAKFVREAGADEVIISTQADIAKEAKRITDGRGVSVVYDGVGKDTFDANLDSLAPAGYLVIYGQSSGYVPPFDLMKLQEKGSLFLTRTNGLPYASEYPRYLEQFAGWVRRGELSIRIDRTYPLADAAKAHEAFEQRTVSGRLLLLP
jgi:NADPH2:quinone reductase